MTQQVERSRVFAGDNEYLRAALESGGDLEPMDYGTELNIASLAIREKLVREFSWAIPNDDALEALAELGPLLELGAGGGYWAYLLRERGVDIIAADPGKASDYMRQKVWTELVDADHTLVRQHLDRALFFCWPTYSHSWAFRALRETHAERVAYVGEMGGCTADEAFHAQLFMDFKQVKSIEIPRWYGVHDYLSIWER